MTRQPPNMSPSPEDDRQANGFPAKPTAEGNQEGPGTDALSQEQRLHLEQLLVAKSLGEPIENAQDARLLEYWLKHDLALSVFKNEIQETSNLLNKALADPVRDTARENSRKSNTTAAAPDRLEETRRGRLLEALEHEPDDSASQEPDSHNGAKSAPRRSNPLNWLRWTGGAIAACLAVLLAGNLISTSLSKQHSAGQFYDEARNAQAPEIDDKEPAATFGRMSAKETAPVKHEAPSGDETDNAVASPRQDSTAYRSSGYNIQTKPPPSPEPAPYPAPEPLLPAVAAEPAEMPETAVDGFDTENEVSESEGVFLAETVADKAEPPAERRVRAHTPSEEKKRKESRGDIEDHRSEASDRQKGQSTALADANTAAIPGPLSVASSGSKDDVLSPEPEAEKVMAERQVATTVQAVVSPSRSRTVAAPQTPSDAFLRIQQKLEQGLWPDAVDIRLADFMEAFTKDRITGVPESGSAVNWKWTTSPGSEPQVILALSIELAPTGDNDAASDIPETASFREPERLSNEDWTAIIALTSDIAYAYHIVGYNVKPKETTEVQDSHPTSVKLPVNNSHATYVFALALRENTPEDAGLATVHLKAPPHQAPGKSEASWTITVPRKIPSLEATENTTQLAVIAATLADVLSGSPYFDAKAIETILARARDLLAECPDDLSLQHLVQWLEWTAALEQKTAPPATP